MKKGDGVLITETIEYDFFGIGIIADKYDTGVIVGIDDHTEQFSIELDKDLRVVSIYKKYVKLF